MQHTKEFTHDWFSQNIENWQRWLGDFQNRPDICALEIGSFEGRSTTWLLENVLTHETSSIDCIDLFTDDYYHRFRCNVAPWANRVRAHRGPSFSVLPTLTGEFDIVYVDGDHIPFAVLSDAVLAWPRLKVGGLMIFDDYLFLPLELNPINALGKPWSPELALKQIAKHPGDSPKTAIDGFLASMIGNYEIVDKGYQVAIRKVAFSPIADPPPTKWPTGWGSAA
jgi:hypothetical protein